MHCQANGIEFIVERDICLEDLLLCSSQLLYILSIFIFVHLDALALVITVDSKVIGN